ncbi:alpha/beta fold hydrolase [Nocardiopsis sp. NPDC055551]|uniref:alpha/beta fold hydrolase n=1 Tax=Nocardiopsis sp. NPDC006832 TaxID=3157188 RepID=UPI0033E47E6B
MEKIYRNEETARRIRDRYEQELERWPVPAERCHLPTREGQTFVLVTGPEQAPPLVLLHGSGANATTWRADIAAWSEHFRVHAVDLVGEPGLSAPSRPDLATESSALWLDDVLSGLGLERVALAGMSLGGWTALDYAIRRPGRVSRLVVVCPGGVGAQRRWRILGAGLLMLFGRRGRVAATSYLTGLDGPAGRTMLEAVLDNFSGFRPRTERLPIFTDQGLRALSMPVSVIVGGRDRMFDSAGTARRMRALAPKAQVRVLPGVGHAVLEQTEPVLGFLRA